MSGILMPYLGIVGQQGYNPPSAIPNLTLWYNASDNQTTVNNTLTNNFQSNPLTDGTTVTKWKDLSGVGQDSNQNNAGGGTGPLYKTGIQNGLSSLLYASASKTNLDINPISWINSVSAFTIFTIARPTSLPVTAFPLVVSDNSCGVWWNGTNWSVGITAGNRGTVTLADDTTKFHIYGIVYDGTQTGNANRLKLIYDNTQQSLTFTGTIPANTGSQSYMYFGGNNRTGGNGGALASTYMNGYIGEVMIWTRVLTAAELINVDGYLKTKWNV